MTVGRAATLTLALPVAVLVLVDLLAVGLILSLGIGAHRVVDFIFASLRDRSLNRRDLW